MTVRLQRLSTRGGRLRADAVVSGSPAAVATVQVRAVGREGGREVLLGSATTTPAPTEGDTHRCTVVLDLALEPLLQSPTGGSGVAGLHDLLLDVDVADGTRTTTGLRDPGRRGRRGVRDAVVRQPDRHHLVLPYFSAGNHRLVLRVESYAPADLAHLRRWLALAPLLAPLRGVAGIWLVGELPYKAQDNGYHLFAWLRRHEPRRRVYYVIDPASPDHERVAALGNVVEHGSRRHVRLSLLASRFLSTHHAEYLLASRSRRMRRWARGVRVALRHGVLGTKDMTPLYGQPSAEYRTDLMLASSELERSIMVQDLGYRPGQVHVTGMPRLDALLRDVPDPEPVLLVVPTWRDWLQHEHRFVQSEFLQRWRVVLTDPRLRAAADAQGVEVVVLLHPNMRGYAHHLDVPGVRVLRQGEEEVQGLLRRSAFLLTDYSSVGFDFSFLERPVVYYQFDRARFLGPRGSHLDLDVHLPGPVARTHEALVELVTDVLEAGPVIAPEMAERSRGLLAHRDTANSERVVAVARRGGGPLLGLRRPTRGPLPAALLRRWRRSRTYRPVLRALFRVLRVLPRQDLVVLETDTGRGHGDSPRRLHEALRRRPGAPRAVWLTRPGVRLADPTVPRLDRGSVRAFVALARARWWITNQNLPPELAPARGTTYVQTWHGTPLKRMQHDVPGTSPELLATVSRATAHWDVLLSPSPYATAAFRSAFRYDGEVLELGYPRNDVLHGPGADDLRRLVRARLGLVDDRTVVLHAPTFRDGGPDAQPEIDLAAFVEMLGATCVLVLRRHPLQRRLRIPAELAGSVVDASAYPDASELLLAADVLVTDYSSLMFDHASLGRPIVLLAPDLEHYRDAERGFYLDLEAEAPGPVVRTTAELVEQLRDLDAVREAYRERLAGFAATYAPRDDGGAADRVLDALGL